MKIRVADFKGVVTKMNPRIMPENAAWDAVNLRLDDGALSPICESSLTLDLGHTAVSIHQRTDGTWLDWNFVVDAAEAPIASDRTYYTQASGPPKVIDGAGTGTTYNLALPAPTSALTIAVDSGTIDAETAESVYYSFTYVTSLDEESAPAPLSNLLVCSTNQIISVTGFPTPPTGRAIDRYRLYRSQTDALGATGLYFVAEFVIASFTPPYLHDITAVPLGELIPSTDYNTPVSNLRGLKTGPGGMMAAFAGKTLYFCEPYVPHAWPLKYALDMDFEIVGVAAIGSSWVIMTKGQPYLVTGTHPANMAAIKLEQNLPCSSAKGIVDLGYSVVYPSPDGLVRVNAQGQIQLVTAGLFTRQQWTEFNPTTICAGQYTGKYIFSYTVLTGGRYGGIIDMSGPAPVYVSMNESFNAAFFKIGQGKLYVLRDTAPETNQIRHWDDENQPKKTAVWYSKPFQFTAPLNFGAVLVETDAYDATGTAQLDVYADNVLVATVTTVNNVARLPSGFLATVWAFKFTGTATITAISLAHSPSELSAP